VSSGDSIKVSDAEFTRLAKPAQRTG